VKFVVDHQLPPALARFLEDQGHAARHVRETSFLLDKFRSRLPQIIASFEAGSNIVELR